jgi:ComF family protein
MQPGCFGGNREAAQHRLHGDRIEAARIVGRDRRRSGHAAQYIEPVLLTRLLATLPGQCGVCRGWSTSRICQPCLTRFAPAVPRCTRCALGVPAGQPLCGVCLREPPPYARTVAAFDYVPPWDHLIARFKFHAALDLAPVFVQHLVATPRQETPTLLLPIPLSEERLRERGYNQAWELARRLARAMHVRAAARLLLRVRDTPHQMALPLERRAGNVRGAFAIEPRRRAELDGQAVALVDDVMTTGATAAEAARVLLQAGAAQVQVWVVARTPRPD